MPWCPKCKSEYREGFTVCSDCGSELVSEKQFAELEAAQAAAEEARRLEVVRLEMERLRKYGLKEMAEAQISEEEAWESGSAGAQEPGEESALQSEVIEFAERVKLGAENLGLRLAEQEEFAGEWKRAKNVGGSSADSFYQDSAERANENRSSAWVLLAMGGAGILVVILGILGVIPLEFSNPYLFYGVMAAVFILFVVSGVVSMRNAIIFEKKAESENSLRDTMLAWCRESLHAEELDEELGMGAGESEEALYFMRFESIKAKLNYQFVNLDQGFLDKFIDDCVYDMIYEKKEESA